MTKHTQGKWYTTAGFVGCQTASGNRTICSMARPDSVMHWAAGPGSNEDSANATLIAAAPDLAEALADMLRNVPLDNSEAWYCRAAQAALAKAGVA